MKLVLPPSEKTAPILRALKTVATANGRFAAQERAMLAAAQDIFGSTHDLDALAPITPDELAQVLTAPQLRWQVVNGLVVVTMIDETVEPSQVELTRAFAAALGVDADELVNLQQIASGSVVALRLDVARRVWLKDHLVERWREGGVRWIAVALGGSAATASKPTLEARRKQRLVSVVPRRIDGG